MPTDRDLTVIIATRNRAESLRTTLDCLARTDRRGVGVDIVVVDNGSENETADVVASFRDELSVSRIVEAQPGKGHALNRALDEADLGSLVAVLDDDMSPHPDWIQGVSAISRRWPQHDFFTGQSYVIWPPGETPAWSKNPAIHGWAYSVMGEGMEEDFQIRTGRWPSGNHFWFRRAALKDAPRFEPIWLTEPWFVLQLQEAGRTGVAGPDAVTGHRIQAELLELSVIRARAVRLGREVARITVRWPHLTRPGGLLFRSLWRFRAICVAGWLRWAFAYAAASCRRSQADRIVDRMIASERLATFAEHLRNAGRARRELMSDAPSLPA